MTINPERAKLPSGVEVVTGYIGKSESLGGVFDGVDRMYLAPLPETVVEVVELAKQAGVRHVVALSQQDVEEEAAQDRSEWHYYAVEKAVEESGLSWTFLRPGQFFTNMLDWADQIRADGVVRAPYPNAAYTPIAPDDIAAAAATCVLNSGHEGGKYFLTGPESLTKLDLVRTIATVTGQDLRFDEQPRDEAYQLMYDAGWGEGANWMLDLDAKVTATPEVPLPTFEQLTGRPATTFAQWVAANAEHFR